MIKIRSSVLNPVRITGKGNEFEFGTPDQLAIISPQTTDVVSVENSPVVFAGFGIIAPEYGWNDYKGIDVKGKTVVVLINDPGLYTGDTALFRGTEMTYYGRWTYKYEEAARTFCISLLIFFELMQVIRKVHNCMTGHILLCYSLRISSSKPQSKCPVCGIRLRVTSPV